MKLLMLCREPRLYSCQRLKEAAKRQGHEMDILDPNRCLLKLSQNPPHFQIFYQENSESNPYLLPDYDAICLDLAQQVRKWDVQSYSILKAKGLFV